MTTSKTTETISGAVESVNAKGTGIKVLGEWLNVSQYHPIVPMPTPGELIEVQVEVSDRGKWITSLRVLEGGLPTSAPSTHTRDSEIRRMSALRSAAIFAGHYATVHEEVRSTDVLKIAEAFERWLEQPEREP